MGLFDATDTRRRKLAEPSVAAGWSGRRAVMRVMHGDALELLRGLRDVDAVVTDPPYGLEFMGHEWDRFVSGAQFAYNAVKLDRERNTKYQRWCERWTRLVFAAMKPGAHLLSFGGTRTFHRLACAIEDAGFEIRDTIMWAYGSGFPKSHDVERAIAVQLCTLPGRHFATTLPREDKRRPDDHICPECAEGLAWDGWGTALKPAWEPIIVARKPLMGNVARNVLRYGTGAVNIDACRAGMTDEDFARTERSGEYGRTTPGVVGFTNTEMRQPVNRAGRWPSNLCHDGSDEVLALFPVSNDGVAVGGKGRSASIYGTKTGGPKQEDQGYGGSGSAARFFYTAKAGANDRVWSKHPTVKPLDLMRWLVRLVTPPGGTVLDCFAGSGTTLEAAVLENFDCIGIEREAEYIADIWRRLEPWKMMYRTRRPLTIRGAAR